MPSKSAKQARMMAAAAHDPKFARRVGVPVSVAKKFNQTDKGTAMLSKALRRKSQKGEVATALIVALAASLLVIGATVTGQQERLCTAMGGTWTPAYPPEDVCPGGSWLNLIRQPKQN